MTAHIAGIPVEEVLQPLIGGMSAALLVGYTSLRVRTRWDRWRRRGPG